MLTCVVMAEYGLFSTQATTGRFTSRALSLTTLRTHCHTSRISSAVAWHIGEGIVQIRVERFIRIPPYLDCREPVVVNVIFVPRKWFWSNRNEIHSNNVIGTTGRL